MSHNFGKCILILAEIEVIHWIRNKKPVHNKFNYFRVLQDTVFNIFIGLIERFDRSSF